MKRDLNRHKNGFKKGMIKGFKQG